MPQITIKTEYVQKLKELGVYDRWLENVKTQWSDDGCEINPNNIGHTLYIAMCADIISFSAFIDASFTWIRSFEGRDFWADISDK